MAKETNKKVLAAAVVGVALLSGVAGAMTHSLLAEPQVQEVVVEKNITVEVPYEVIVEKEVTVTETKVVSVEDVEFLKLVCDRALFDDLQDCKKEITAEDAALKLAIEKVKSDFAREAEREGLIVDDRRAELVRVFDKFGDVEVVYSNFDRSKYEFEIEARIDDLRADQRVDVKFTVTVDNGIVKIVKTE